MLCCFGLRHLFFWWDSPIIWGVCKNVFYILYQVLKSTWNRKQPDFYGCFTWMIPNLYLGNGCFNKHQFINGCLEFQDSRYIQTCQRHGNLTARLPHCRQTSEIKQVESAFSPLPELLNKNWVVVSNIFFFHPYIWGRFPFLLIFFKWVETTN